MPKQYRTIIDAYLSSFSQSKDRIKQEIADIARKRRNALNTASIYNDDPRSFVMAVKDSIYRTFDDKPINAMLNSSRRGRLKIAKRCKKVLDEIVSYKMRFERTDISYEELLVDVIDLNRMCNSFYGNAEKLAKLEEEKSFMERVRRLCRPAVKIMNEKTSDMAVNIDAAVGELLGSCYKLNDEMYLAELEWVQARDRETALEMENMLQDMHILAAEVRGPVSEKRKLEKVVELDRAYGRFQRLRAEVRRSIRAKLNDDRSQDDRWRDVS